MQKLFRLLLLGLVLLLVALVSALATMRMAIHGREVQVPRLAGMDVPRAEAVLAATGLRLEIGDRFYSNNCADSDAAEVQAKNEIACKPVPEGDILSQSPTPGERVRRGWRVEVAVSLGPPRTSVPNVIGESTRAGQLNVQRRGLEVSTAIVNLPGFPPDQVLAQSPPAGLLLSPRVGLLVTPSALQQSFVMPDLTGRTVSQAAQAILAAGLKLSNFPAGASGATSLAETTAEPAPDIPPDVDGLRVVGQTPAAGAKVETGMAVTLTWQAAPTNPAVAAAH